MTAPPLSRAARGDLAFRMVPAALELAGLVQDLGDADSIADLIGALAEQETAALLVVLAAMVDTERTPADLLGWIRNDEHGEPLEPDAVMTVHSGLWRSTVARPTCGRPGGYDRHQKAQEMACDACRAYETQRVLSARRAARAEGAA